MKSIVQTDLAQHRAEQRERISPDLADAYEAIAAQQEMIVAQNESITALQSEIAALKGGTK